MQDITIGITHFNRPKALERLVASIRERFPKLPILVADNGDARADLAGWSDVRVLLLEFDAGLSACRNALVTACGTKFMVLLEEDFIFDDRTDLQAALTVIESDPRMAFVGGSLEVKRHMQHYARAFKHLEVPEGTVLQAVPAGGPMRLTNGVRWRSCDMVFNFGVLRVAAAREVPWDVNLKLAEHTDWFYRLSFSDWKVAHTSHLVAQHAREEPGEYRHYRNRAGGFLKLFREKHGLARFEHTGAHEEPLQATSPIVVFGIGHSGTTIVTKMLQAVGYFAGPADDEFCEHPVVRDLNEAALHTDTLDLDRALDAVEDLAAPWVIKDPRFIHTLDHWLPILGRWQPSLLWVVRDDAAVAESYARRGERYRLGMSLPELYELAKTQFDSWPWAKVRVDYENIANAVGLFDLGRAGGVKASGPVPPQAEPRLVPPATYDGEPGGPCICAEPGTCRRHPAIHKVGRLWDICQGTVLTPEKCEEYRRNWDTTHEVEQVLDHVSPNLHNQKPAECVHRGDFVRICSGGG